MNFDEWLRSVCFQKPTPEAYDLAKDAWNASRKYAEAEELFIKETLQHCIKYVNQFLGYSLSPDNERELIKDVDRCIKIVEKWVKEDKS